MASISTKKAKHPKIKKIKSAINTVLHLDKYKYSELQKITSAMNSVLDLDKLLQLVVEKACKVMKAEFCTILLVDEQTKKFIKQKTRGINQYWEYVEKGNEGKYDKDIPIGGGITSFVLETQKIEVINNINEKNRRFRNVINDAKSEICVPLIHDNILVGVINCECRKKNQFSKNRQIIFQTLADQAAIAITNAKLYHSITQMNKKLTNIYDIGKTINMSLTLDETLKNILRASAKEIKYNFCAILLLRNKRLYAHAGIGFSPKEIATYNAKLGEGVCGVCAMTGKPTIIGDVLKFKKYLNQCPKTRSEMCVPIKYEGKTIGVYNIESEYENAFDIDDLQFLMLLADQAAIAIKNSIYYEKISGFNIKLKKEVDDATRELMKANKELRKLNMMKSEFVNTVSHELRSPLTSIRGYVSLLYEDEVGKVTKKQKEFLNIVKSESERLTRLIDDLLDIGKIESGNMIFKFQNFNLAEFLQSYSKELKTLAKKEKRKIECNIPEELPVIQADPDRIKQIFTNLISNAVKFSGKRQGIRIYVTNKKNYLQVDISDVGVGIANKDFKTIFKRFSQTDNYLTRKAGGTGLGLAITKHLVEMHSGKIWVKSRIGKGSTFSFTLKK